MADIFPGGCNEYRAMRIRQTGRPGRLLPNCRGILAYLAQCNPTCVPSSRHTVALPVSGPAKADSWVAVSMGNPRPASLKLSSASAIRQTISRGKARPLR